MATSFWSRLRGLMGRAELPSGTALVLKPNGSVHTFWMRFPIDVIFTDRSGRVVGLRSAMPPNRPYAGARRAHQTIELPAGVIVTSGTQRGDQLHFDPGRNDAAS
jgi:uncharacterized membrane protein (UPF0127 family)